MVSRAACRDGGGPAVSAPPVGRVWERRWGGVWRGGGALKGPGAPAVRLRFSRKKWQIRAPAAAPLPLPSSAVSHPDILASPALRAQPPAQHPRGSGWGGTGGHHNPGGPPYPGQGAPWAPAPEGPGAQPFPAKKGAQLGQGWQMEGPAVSPGFFFGGGGCPQRTSSLPSEGAACMGQAGGEWSEGCWTWREVDP